MKATQRDYFALPANSKSRLRTSHGLDCLATKRATTDGRPYKLRTMALDYRWLAVLALVFLRQAAAGPQKCSFDSGWRCSSSRRLCIQRLFDR